MGFGPFEIEFDVGRKGLDHSSPPGFSIPFLFGRNPRKRIGLSTIFGKIGVNQLLAPQL
jgi:hypothetical protein